MTRIVSLLGALALTGIVAAQPEGVKVQDSRCEGALFLDPPPGVVGIEVTNVMVGEVSDWNEWGQSVPATPGLPVQPKKIRYCDVQLTYTHIGMNDSIRVDVWLPKKKDWNGKFLGQGGLGWAAGNQGALASGVALGFATAQTDSGHSYGGGPVRAGLESAWWGLKSKGNVNLNELQNNGYRALDELAIVAKHVINAYYQKAPSFSYWNGCSTGGRQGMVLAQRYPEHFNGIISSAPSQNWATFLITEHWGHVKMKELNYYPAACELFAVRAAAIEACDELDGIKDNVIASRSCKLDHKKVIGQKYTCGEEERKITKQAVEIAASVWDGPLKNGKPVWYGLAHEAALPGLDPLYKGLAATTCDESNKNCKSDPFPISADYIKTWVEKDSDFDMTTIDETKWWQLFRKSRAEYSSFLDANDPDLEPFKASGGKMIHWHGLADQLIPPNGSLNYYLRVQEELGNTDDFYRYFEAPGIAHCFGGDGAFPTNALHSLQDWVEKGKAPDSIVAESIPALSSNPQGTPHQRPICPYPKVQKYVGGNIYDASSFKCANDFGSKKPKEEDTKPTVLSGTAPTGKSEL